MLSTSGDYDIKVRNDVLDRILSIMDESYFGVYKISDTILIAIALAYFGLSENYLITTDKKESRDYLRNKLNIPFSYLWDFFEEANKEISYNANKNNVNPSNFLSIIRNGLFHGAGSVEPENGYIHIKSGHIRNEMDCYIPFAFFEKYLDKKLTNKININSNEFYIFSCFRNRGYRVFGDTKSNSADFIFSNGILPFRIIPIPKNGNYTLEKAEFQNFLYYFELIFSRNYDGDLTSFLDYYNKFKVEFAKVFYERFPGYDLDISLNSPANLDDILNISENTDTIFDARSLAHKLNKTIYREKNGHFEILPEIYKGIIRVNQIVESNKDKQLPGENISSSNLDSERKELIDYRNLVVNNKEDVLTMLLYVLGINTLLITDDKLYRDDSVFSKFDIRMYTVGEYNNSFGYSQGLQRKLEEAKMSLDVFREQFLNCNSQSGKDYLASMIFAKQSEIADLEDAIEEKKVREISIYPNMEDKLNEVSINDSNTVKMNDKHYMLITDHDEIKRIIRNCFAHPGRIKVKDNNGEYRVEFMDISDSGEVTSIGFCSLTNLLYFLTQDEILNKYNMSKRDHIA